MERTPRSALYETESTTAVPRKAVKFCVPDATYVSNTSPQCTVVQRNGGFICRIKTTSHTSAAIKHNAQTFCMVQSLTVVDQFPVKGVLCGF